MDCILTILKNKVRSCIKQKVNLYHYANNVYVDDEMRRSNETCVRRLLNIIRTSFRATRSLKSFDLSTGSQLTMHLWILICFFHKFYSKVSLQETWEVPQTLICWTEYHNWRGKHIHNAANVTHYLKSRIFVKAL
jgi:hypothetical protein